MAASDSEAREQVLQEMTEEIRGLAFEGIPAKEIEHRVNGRQPLTGEEQDVVYLITWHAVAEARGRY